MIIENKLVFVLSILIFAVSLLVYKIATAWYIEIPAIMAIIAMIEWNYEVNVRSTAKINWLNKE